VWFLEIDMFRTLAAAVVVTLFTPVMPAAAAGNDALTLAAAGAAAVAEEAATASTRNSAPLATDVDWSLPAVQVGAPARGSILPTLYASLAALNAFDAYSTTKGLSRGASEANPLMKSVAGNPTALWAVKGGATAASIVVAERLWKQNRKGQAIAVMVVTNGMMAVVAAKNASVLR
jgi:hypothetical protein